MQDSQQKVTVYFCQLHPVHKKESQMFFDCNIKNCSQIAIDYER